MSDADARVEFPQHSTLLTFARMILLCLAVLIFTLGSIAYFLSNLPLSVPLNTSSLIRAMLHPGISSPQALTLFSGLLYVGRILEPPPSPPQMQRPIFPWWLLNRPFNGVVIGVFIFSLPIQVIIGLSGIAYLLSFGLLLYNTPRLLAKGAIGIAALLMLCFLGGVGLAALLPVSFTVEECRNETNFLLRSGEKLPCSEFMFVGDANGFIIRHDQSSIFLPLADLTSEARDELRAVHRSLRSEFNLFD
ncbi:hypothetical protein RMS29_002715 [Agrobacterium rosae]|uniref:Uncharacterized protein n=1 Tax=Agrobacterium rosae TaxID=1972867 RepID=A0ABU4W0N2_9HYPH|nr:hypothetical protein [Agrobacterium rosae]MCM2433919.1 hypothetical protein [Agrobacterium rosae]MDX8330526.1 hypothetical protein [Agrobacterium rosae]